MDTARVGSVRAYRSDGSVEHVLLRWGKFDARNLLVTWNEVAPRGMVRGHTHAGSEQVYVIVSGTARVQIKDERQVLAAGTLVYVPPNTPHNIANTGSDPLVFISAASPPFPIERLYAEGAVEEACPAPARQP
jgi:mannose-6-phosphate isomerase-like protein (cupin superfamily)